MQRPRDGRYTKAVSGQRLGKHVPAATDMKAKAEELCLLCGPYRDIISKGQGPNLVSSVRESVKKELEPRDRGIAIVGTVTRKRLVTA
jgi:hypothetical protein